MREGDYSRSLAELKYEPYHLDGTQCKRKDGWIDELLEEGDIRRNNVETLCLSFQFNSEKVCKFVYLEVDILH